MRRRIKYITIMIVFLMVFSQPVFAANYVPSITYKPTLPVVEFDKEQETTGAVSFLTGHTPLIDVDKDNPEFTSAQTGYE